MQVRLDCVPCFQQQALRAARAAGAPEDVQQQVLRQVVRDLAASDWDDTPIDLGIPVHRTVRRLTGVDDPFAEAKRTANEAALAHYERLERMVAEADDPLRMAVRVAIAGNIMDLGALEEYDLEETLERVTTADFAVDDYDLLLERLDAGESVLLFADNAGEIVFDRLLLETIARLYSPRLSVVVKSGPFINDATIDDARQAGIDGIEGVRLLQVSNGDEGDAPGYASETVTGWLSGSDTVIAKGQANYEALSEREDVFFLLVAKCPCVAASVGVDVGGIILQHSVRRKHGRTA